MSNKPEDIVAERIIEKIKADGLLPDDQIEKFKRELLAGVIKPEGWKYLAEFSLQREEGQDE